MISQIAAMSQNRVIGTNGKLPWNIPEDMKFFKNKTKGHAIIMGRKTFESMPQALPYRLNIIITRQKDYVAKGAKVFSEIDRAIAFCQEQTDQWGKEIFIIGGGEIYKQTLDKTDRIYLTVIHQDYRGDALFPEFDKSQFELVKREDCYSPQAFSFLTYQRK